MRLTNEKKGLVVKTLLEKNLYETGLEFGFDKHYKDSTAVKNAVYRIYQAAKVEPEKYFLSPDILTEVESRMSARTPAVIRENQHRSLREQIDEKTNTDFKDLVLSGRKLAFGLLLRKMERAGRNNKALDEINLSTLAQTFGIIFDKAQIIQGEATENVAVLGRIDTNMKPEDALKAVLGMRDIILADKEKAKNKK